MSLSTLLLGSSSAKDEALDQLFRSSVPARVSNQNEDHQSEAGKERFSKREQKATKKKSGDQEDSRSKEETRPLGEVVHSKEIKTKKGKSEKSKRRREEEGAMSLTKKKRKSTLAEETIHESPAKGANEIPASFAATIPPLSKAEGPSSKARSTKEEAGETDDDSEGDPSQLVHESLLDGSQKSRRTRYAPEGETNEKRSARTLFIGNVPAAAVKEKSVAKSLKRHILTFLPSTSRIKIESMRFRSVPFQTPTSKLPSETPVKGKGKERQHELDRASSWKTAHPAPAGDENGAEKKFLTPAQKKKIAFIKGDLHNEADSVNAYIVLAHPPPLPSSSEAEEKEDVYDIAKSLANDADGSLFMEHLIRVSVAVSKSSAVSGTDGDPKKSIFVGSLDFAAKEDDLRIFFETLLCSELGQEGGGQSEEKGNYVARVRIIRDKDTQLGKGFGYVQFTDKKYVDEVLAMDMSKLKFAKRKLRVQRCKALPSSSSQAAPSSTKNAPLPESTSSAPMPVILPKGDPLLGAQLANLSKEERKLAKASNADRIARRLAKKKARNALHVAPVMDRKRERKLISLKKDHGSKKDVKNKGRVRSDRSIARRNVKK